MNRFEFYSNLQKYKENEELKHYGTIGQKWGVRKWQNPDGTFNEAGKERYFGTKKKSSGSDDEEKEVADFRKRSEQFSKRMKNLPKENWYEENEKFENDLLNDKYVKKHYDKVKEIYNKTNDWNECYKYLKKTPIADDQQDTWISNIMEEHIVRDSNNTEYGKLGKFTLMPSVSKKMFDFGINTQRKILDWESTKQSQKNFADSIKENRDMYDAKNLTDEEIDDIVMNRMKTYTSETAAAEFNTQSLRYQLEKALNTELGSISKPKIKVKYLNEDGTLNEEGKARVHAKANASSTASAVFKILKWLKIAGMPITAISGISLAAMGAPATLVVAALAGLGIQGLSATGNHIISKKLENRSSNYYKMLNGGNVNE